jgi:DoxX.
LKMFRWLGWAVVWLAAVFYLQNGIQKILGTDQMVAMFHELGLPDWFRVVVGCAEAVGAVVLAIPRYTFPASIGLGALMAGAVAVEIGNGHVLESLIAGQWLVLFVAIGIVRYKIRTKQQAKPNA